MKLFPGHRDESEEESLATEPFTGWRWWHVAGDPAAPILVSWWLNTHWPDRRALRARCGYPGDLPHEHHPCGIHAFSSVEIARAYAGDYVPLLGYPFSRPPGGRLCLAFGRVSLWGRVREHERGYRAEFAYPYDVTLVDGTQRLARTLADRYAVDTRAASHIAV